MLLYFCYGIVILHVINADSRYKGSKNYNDPKDTEVLFAGVVKNITRVNNVLQELIHNYEQLQKIYKSQENVESVDSDQEIDEVFKSNIKKQKKAKTTSRAFSKDEFPATQMIWSEERKKEYSSYETKENTDGNKNPDETVPNSTPVNVKPESNFNRYSSSSDNENEELKPATLKKFTASETPTTMASHEKAELIFIDTEKIKEHNKKLEFVPLDKTSEPPKTRYSKISHSDQIERERSQTPRSQETDNEKKSTARKVENLVRSEAFSPKNIWDEIIGNTPIQLRTHDNEFIKRTREGYIKKPTHRSEKIDKKPNFKNVNSKDHLKSLDYMEKQEKKKPIEETEERKKEEKNTPIEESEGDDEIGKDTFKTNVLREAYADACLRLVVRKCYKALGAAHKMFCVKFKCKSNFNEKYKTYSRRACIAEFHGNASAMKDQKSQERRDGGQTDIADTSDKSVVLHYVRHRSKNESNRGDNAIDDLSGRGYIQSCLPHIEAEMKGYPSVKTIPSLRNGTSVKANNFTVLRDRFEKECKKQSSQKCRKACEFAYKETCASYSCDRDKTKMYKKACRVKCRSAYNVRNDSDSSSSDSESESDSSSSTSSD